MAEVHYFTKEGLEKLKNDLHNLKTVERKKVTQAIADARDKGDLSENAEYDAAKEAQGLMEMKISQMVELVAYARIIDESKIDNSKVLILSKVKVKNVANKMEMEYTLVSEEEADLKLKKISVSSPIGKGLLGLKLNDVAEIKVPAGLMKLEVINISR
jgi:transcription elongation factor GreA